MTPGHATVLLAAAALAFPACAHVSHPEIPDTSMPDAGAIDPCAPSGRPVNLLTPEERRLFCIRPEPNP